MINATEAREIVKTSDKSIERILNALDPKIRAAAEKGESSLDCFEENTWVTVGPYEHGGEKATPLMEKLLASLQKLGYNACYASGDPYVPRGLADYNGEGPSHYSYFIRLRW